MSAEEYIENDLERLQRLQRAEMAYSNRRNIDKFISLPPVFKHTPWKAARYAWIEIRDLIAGLWVYRLVHWLIVALYWTARAAQPLPTKRKEKI